MSAPLPAEPAADEPVAPTDPNLSSKTAEPDLDWAPTENPNATIVPGKMRSDREEVPAPFTKADADQAEIKEARRSTSRAAAGCENYWPTTFDVCGAIRDKYNSLGGPASFLSFPNSPEYTNPDGFGKRTQFWNGPIYWSNATGAHPVVNSFLNRWGILGYEAGRLHYPTTDEIVLPDGGRRQEFQDGVIYVAFQNAIGAALFNGPVRDKYNTLGGLAPGGTLLGYPTQDQVGLPDGQGQMDRFLNGVIYWSPSTGAHPVVGIILAEWTEAGYETGQYRYPISDEYTQNQRRTQDFQIGKIDFGLENPVSHPFFDCQVNVSWPKIDQTSYWVYSYINVRCTDPKRAIGVRLDTFFTPAGGTERNIDTSRYALDTPANNVHNFDNYYRSICRTGTWRVRANFTIQNADGGQLNDTERTSAVPISGCQSKPPQCPSSMSQTDCQATLNTYVYIATHNGASPPNYNGSGAYDNNNHLLPDPVGNYVEYDVYSKEGGTRRAERIILDTAQTGTIIFSKDHYTTAGGFTTFMVPFVP